MTEIYDDTVGTTNVFVPLTAEARLSRAEDVIRRNVMWGFGAGVLPLPLFDLMAATAVQVKMVKELSGVYGVAFREDLAKKLLASLLSGAVGIAFGATIGFSLAKFIPVIGQAVGAVMAPITVGAVTYATGRVFIMHFEAGGTLLDFDARGMREHFKAEFASAKPTVSRMFNDNAVKVPGAPL